MIEKDTFCNKSNLCSEDMTDYNKNSTNNIPCIVKSKYIPTNIEMVSSSISDKNTDFDTNNCESETHSKSSKTSSTQVPIICASEHSSGSVANVANTSQKMGSRRIFTPQFKLQVLESYRNDNDCKGNQRATARKYNIHRRQIQKWLQCEANLRSSVTSVVPNNVKHQFHNISQQQMPSTSHHMHMQPNVLANGTSHSHFGSYVVQHHQTQSLPRHRMLSIDTTKEITSSIQESAKSSSVKAEVSSAQEFFAAANLAAVVAVAAVAGAADAMATVSTSTAHPSSTQTSTMSILRPTAVGGRNGRVLSPTMHHFHPQSRSHHQHNYHHQQPHSLPSSYNHTPVSVAVPLPMLPHHVSPQSIHHNFNNQYQSVLTHTHPSSVRTAAATEMQAKTAYVPTVCLPLVSSSALTSAKARTDARITTAKTSNTLTAANLTSQDVDKDTNLNSIVTTTTPIENSYVHCQSNRFFNYFEQEIERNQCSKSFHNPQFDRSCPLMSYGLTPMDLSIGQRRSATRNKSSDVKGIVTQGYAYDQHATNNDQLFSKTVLRETSVVDLTSKKRKAPLVNDHDHIEYNKNRRISGCAGEVESGVSLELNNERKPSIELKTVSKNKLNVDDDIDVDVASIDQEDKVSPSKPIKLFKPYLLDNNDDAHGEQNKISNFCQKSEQQQPIIWSNHPACLSAHSYDNSSYNFQCSNFEKQTFLLGSPYSYERSISSSSPQSTLSPSTSSVPAISPNIYGYTKGSPVSGYESSSSTCSELNLHTNFYLKDLYLDMEKNYCYHKYEHYNSVDRQLENNVQKWLDHDIETHKILFANEIAT